MTPEHFCQCLDTLNLSSRAAAALMCVDDRLVRRWMIGERPVPSEIERFLVVVMAAKAGLVMRLTDHLVRPPLTNPN